MAIAAIVYISVSALLVVSAGIFFVKAIQSLMKQKPISNQYPDQVMFLQRAANDPTGNDPASDSFVIYSQREEIIAMLERQFASSPSSDS